jgi:tripartite motif-containing protein 71
VRSIGNGEVREKGQLNSPRGICSANGFLNVCDTGNHRVQVFRLDGSYARTIGSQGSGPGEFNCPSGICYESGHLYITDNRNHRVQVFFCINGKYVRAFGSCGNGKGQFSFPHSICASNGYISVTDSGNHRVQVFHYAASHQPCTYFQTFGRMGSELGRFSSPFGICFDAGWLYVCDYQNCRVQVLKGNGGSARSFADDGDRLADNSR